MTERYGAEANGHVLVAGGAGFIGSHLIDALLIQGARVTCLDSFRTGRRQNLAHLAREPDFDLIEADVTGLLPPLPRMGQVFNRACAASPPHDQADPLHTMMTSVLGTIAWFSREVAPRERARPEPLAAAAV